MSDQKTEQKPDHEKRIREALESVPLPHEWAVCQDPPNPYWFKGTTIGASDPDDARRIADTCVLSPDAERFATYIAACNPSAIRALLADLDAMRGALERIAADGWKKGYTFCHPEGCESPGIAIAALKGASHE